MGTIGTIGTTDTIGTSEECPLKRGVRYIEVLRMLVYFACEICSMVSRDSAIDPKVCQEACVGKDLGQYLRESNVYMIIWKPLVGELLQYVEKSTNEVEKNTVALLCTNAHYKRRWLAMCNRISP